MSRRKKRKLPPWSHGPIYAAVRAAAALCNAFPPDETIPVLRALGGGWAGLPINRTRLRRAEDNLAWCFPEWDRANVRAHALEAYRHLFAIAAEVILAPRLLTLSALPESVRLGNMIEGLRALLSGGPTILITGHCGNWELLGGTLAALGLPIHALYRPLDLKPLDAWVYDTRSRRGLTLVDKFGASHDLPAIIDRAAPVGFIADQNAGERGIHVPFFGRLASSYKTIALLAIRHEARVVCGTARRLSPREAAAPHDSQAAPHPRFGRYRSLAYEISISDVIEPRDWEGQPDPVFYITARYRRAIEAMVRAAPEQYLWMHRYWKTRPAHEREGKPFPPRLLEKLRALPWMTPNELDRVVERSARDTENIRAHGKLAH